MRIRFSIRTLLVTITVISIVIVGTLGFASWVDPFDDLTFTPTAWKEAATIETCAAMSRDLVKRHILAGMSQLDVVALLGPPDDISKRGATTPGVDKAAQIEIYTYYIGSWSMYSFDDAFVYVHFDLTQKVVWAEVTGY